MSANSEDAIRESYGLILKLKDRTRQGKVEWATLKQLGSISEAISKRAECAFEMNLGGNLAAIVWETSRSVGFCLVELDFSSGPPLPPHLNQPSKDYERKVLSIELDKDEAGLGKITDESIVFEDLTALVALIRRAPVRSDARIEQANTYLDELAS